MGRVLIIGAGGVGKALTHKCAEHNGIFDEIFLASRTREKCDAVTAELNRAIRTATVNADDEDDVSRLIALFKPDVVVNAALPAQNLPIMRACLAEGVHYIDTSAPEPDPFRYELFTYRHQLALGNRFRGKNLVALLSLGFDPGVTNIFCAWAAKHLFDEIHRVDILDCNAGRHSLPFATNFNTPTNIQELTQQGLFWEEGRWRRVQPFSLSRFFDFPEVGPRRMYLIYHEELETLVRHIPGLKKMRFWMHLGEDYLTHLKVLFDLGLASMEPKDVDGVPVRPLSFLRRLLPDPASLGPHYTGKTNIGCLFEGWKNGTPRRCYLYNVCDHEMCYRETKSQAVSYTTAVPAMVGAKLIIGSAFTEKGVILPEELNPDLFMDELVLHGLPWNLLEDPPNLR